MKLVEALDIFLGEYDNPATRRTYEIVLSRFLEWVGNRQPSQVEGIDLVRYLQSLKPSMAEATLEKHKKTLKTFFLWMSRLKLVDKEIVTSIRQHRVINKVRKEKAMTDDELLTLLDYLKWFPRNYAIVQFLAKTGCRAGGVSKLQIKHLDLENQLAEVTEKGDKTREVMYDEEAALAINKWLIQRPATDNQYVFVTDKGGQMSSASISQMIRRACHKVGIRSLGPHSLRHRIGFKFAEEKLAPTITQSYLGHSNVETTLKHYYPDGWKHAADTIRVLISTSNEKTTHQRIIDLHKKSSNA